MALDAGTVRAALEILLTRDDTDKFNRELDQAEARPDVKKKLAIETDERNDRNLRDFTDRLTKAEQAERRYQQAKRDAIGDTERLATAEERLAAASMRRVANGRLQWLPGTRNSDGHNIGGQFVKEFEAAGAGVEDLMQKVDRAARAIDGDDRSSLGGSVRNMGASLQSVAPRFSGLFHGIMLLAAPASEAITALTAGVGGLSSALAGAGAGGAVAGGSVLSAFGQGLLVAKLGAKDLTDALSGNAEAYKRLTAEGKKFYDFIKQSHIGADVKKAADNMLPGLRGGMEAAMANKGVLTSVVGSTASTLGRVAQGAGQWLGRGDVGNMILAQSGQNNQTIERAGKGLINLADAALRVVRAGSGLTDWLTKSALQMTHSIDAWSKSAKGAREMGDLFGYAQKELSHLGGIAKNTGSALVSVFRAGSGMGDWILSSIEKGTKGLADWAKSARGQHSMKQFFEDAKPALREVTLLVGDIFKALGKLSKEGSLQPLIHMIREDALPAFVTVAGAIGKIVRWISRASDESKAFSGALKVVAGAFLVWRTFGPMLLGIGGAIRTAGAAMELFGLKTRVATAETRALGVAGTGRFAAMTTGLGRMIPIVGLLIANFEVWKSVVKDVGQLWDQVTGKADRIPNNSTGVGSSVGGQGRVATRFASGGVVDKASLAVVGEDGMEVVAGTPIGPVVIPTNAKHAQEGRHWVQVAANALGGQVEFFAKGGVPGGLDGRISRFHSLTRREDELSAAIGAARNEFQTRDGGELSPAHRARLVKLERDLRSLYSQEQKLVRSTVPDLGDAISALRHQLGSLHAPRAPHGKSSHAERVAYSNATRAYNQRRDRIQKQLDRYRSALSELRNRSGKGSGSAFDDVRSAGLDILALNQEGAPGPDETPFDHDIEVLLTAIEKDKLDGNPLKQGLDNAALLQAYQNAAGALEKRLPSLSGAAWSSANDRLRGLYGDIGSLRESTGIGVRAAQMGAFNDERFAALSSLTSNGAGIGLSPLLAAQSRLVRQGGGAGVTHQHDHHWDVDLHLPDQDANGLVSSLRFQAEQQFAG